MAVPLPKYSELMLPLLRIAAAGETTIPISVEQIGRDLKLTPEQMQLRMPDNNSFWINYRAHWAKTYLVKAGLLSQPRRGVFVITPRGETVLAENPQRLDRNFLIRFPEFASFVNEKGNAERAETSQVSNAMIDETPPIERIDQAQRELSKLLRSDIIERIFGIEPVSARAKFFEGLVISLLLAMGYGGARDGAGLRTGGPGDGGVDGVINQDALGLDPVYVQAKCYDRQQSIGPQAIQAFKGALDDHGAMRGVFITTARFSAAALHSGRASQKQIALIDGDRLAELMEQFDVGVQVERVIKIKKLDEDFFGES